MTREQTEVPDNQTAEVDDNTDDIGYPVSEADHRAFQEWCVDRSRIDYLATDNPMYVFRGYLYARRLGTVPPDWILENFDRAFEKFWRAHAEFSLGLGPNDPATAFSAAFGVKKTHKGKRSGGPTCWDEFNSEENKFVMGSHVEQVILEWRAHSRTIKQMAAVAEATKRYNKEFGTNVSEATMRRAWLEFRESLARPDRQRLREIMLQHLAELLKPK